MEKAGMHLPKMHKTVLLNLFSWVQADDDRSLKTVRNRDEISMFRDLAYLFFYFPDKVPNDDAEWKVFKQDRSSV